MCECTQVSNVRSLLHAGATTDHPRKGQPTYADRLMSIRRYTDISPQTVHGCSAGNLYLICTVHGDSFHFTGFTTKHTVEFKSVSFPDPRLSQSDLNEIVSLLKECSYKWREIGASLGFRSEELNSISERPSLYFSSPDSYLRELLSQWLDWPTPYHPDPPTWEILLQALKRADLKELAERVNKEVGIYGKCIEVLVQCTCVDSLVPRHSRGGKREPTCAVYACAYMYTSVFLHSSFFSF